MDIDAACSTKPLLSTVPLTLQFKADVVPRKHLFWNDWINGYLHSFLCIVNMLHQQKDGKFLCRWLDTLNVILFDLIYEWDLV
jgi:hypothetical protein